MSAPTLTPAPAPTSRGGTAVGGVPRPPQNLQEDLQITEHVVLRRLAVLVAVLMIGCASLRAGWAGWSAFAPLVIAGGTGAALTVLLRKIGAAAPVTIVVGVVIPALVMIVLGRGHGDSILSSLVDPFPRLLTAPFPAPLTTSMLVPGLVVAWLAGVIGAARIFSRHYLFTPIVVGISILTCGELLTAGRSDLSGLVTLAMVVVFCLHLASWSMARHRGLPKATVAAVLLGALALGVGYTNVLGEPFSPRDYIRQPTQHQSEPNPLPRLSEWAQNPDQEILRRSGDQVPLRIAVLPDYDGFTFGNNSKFGPLEDSSRPILPPGKPRQFKVNVSTDTDMRWLPTPGTPNQVTIPDALVDVDTGTMVSPTLRQGVTSYTVTATVDSFTENAVSGADVPTDGTADRYLQTPQLPEQLRTYAQTVTKDSATRWGQAQALESSVRANRKFVPDAPGGSSYARLGTFLLADPSQPGGQAGTSEQFASAYAVLARSVGLPTRVVVGVGNGLPVSGGTQGESVVLGRDAVAWPEVYFTGVGWVPFNPTPNTMDPSQAAAQQGGNSNEQPPPPPPPPSGQAPEIVVPKPKLWLIPSIVGGALLVLVATMALARGLRRGRHRKAGTVGAWFDLEDAMRLAGMAPRGSDPAAVKAERIGGEPARELARTAEAQTFGPGGGGDAPDAWRQRTEAAKELRRSSSRWRRFIWPISLAPWWGGRRVPGMNWVKSLWPGRRRRG